MVMTPLALSEASTDALVTICRELRELAAAGEDLRSLAAEYGITSAPVTQPVTGKFRVAAGGPIREAKPRSVLTDEDVAEIRRLAGDGVAQAELARRPSLPHLQDHILPAATLGQAVRE